ncbi:MAG TPA: non-heme iron oxygenase ferredoxin subunit [Acidobacteriota bacterium]
MAAQYIPVAKPEEIEEGTVLMVEVSGARLGVCKVEGRIYAFEDVCTHDDGPLAEGELSGCAIECPRHGARFDVRTGAVLSMPAVVPIRTFPVQVQGDQVLVDVEKL